MLDPNGNYTLIREDVESSKNIKNRAKNVVYQVLSTSTAFIHKFLLQSSHQTIKLRSIILVIIIVFIFIFYRFLYNYNDSQATLTMLHRVDMSFFNKVCIFIIET
jgi:hypothetical protein